MIAVVFQWFPWTDLPAAVGGLMLLEGSASLPGFDRLRKTYGQTFDSCNTNIDSPYLTDDPGALLGFDPSQRWVCGGAECGYRAGDVVIFAKHCIHGSTANTTADRVRLSTDVRFQPASDPVDYRHTTTPGRELAGHQSIEHMAAMHALFDQRKASLPHPGPTRSMADALWAWEVLGSPRPAL